MEIIQVNAYTDQVRTVLPENLHHWLNPSMGGATEFIMYAAMEEGAVLGFIIYGKVKEYYQVYQIIYITVEEQNRGKGIAKELIKVTLGYLKKQGAKRIVLSEGPENMRGRFLLDGNVDYEEKKSAVLVYTVGKLKKAVVSDYMHKLEPFIKNNIKAKEEITDSGMISQFEKDTFKKNLKVTFDEMDSDYSCFWVSGNQICAYMSITDMEGGYFYVKNMEVLHKNNATKFAIPIMMAYFVKESMKNCPEDTRFGITILGTRLIEPTKKYLDVPDEILEFTDYYLL